MARKTQGSDGINQLEADIDAKPPSGAEVVRGENQPFTAQFFRCLACGQRGMKSEGTYRTQRGIKRYRKCTSCGNTVSTIQRHGDIERLG